jgi:predicted transcriptional regulator
MKAARRAREQRAFGFVADRIRADHAASFALLQAAPRGLTADELAEQAGISQGKAKREIQALRAIGAVDRATARRRTDFHARGVVFVVVPEWAKPP